MSQFRFFIVLLSPSFLSGSLVLLVSFGILGVHGWQTIHENQLFYEYLFGPFGFFTSGINQNGDNSGLFAELLRSDVTYKVVVAVVALIAGILAYVLISAIQRSADEGLSLLHAIRSHGRFNRTYRRMTISFVSFLCWILYTYFSLILLVPFCISLLEIGLTTIALSDASGWFSCLGALGLLWLTLHIHIIFMRLFMLRLRLFDTTTAQLLELEFKE